MFVPSIESRTITKRDFDQITRSPVASGHKPFKEGLPSIMTSELDPGHTLEAS